MKVHQGVTLEVVGQDGLGAGPGQRRGAGDAARRAARLERRPSGSTGAGARRGVPRPLRRHHGRQRRAPRRTRHAAPDAWATRIARRRRRARRHARAAWARPWPTAPPASRPGSPTRPGMYADDDELVELCRVMSGGAFYCPHHRNYGSHALQGYADSIEIARRAGVPLHLAHCHLGFPVNRGRAPELLALIDAARADGVEVTLDTYPYLAGATYLHAFLPGWALAGPRDRRGACATRRCASGFATSSRTTAPTATTACRGLAAGAVDGESVAAIAGHGRRPIDVYCDLCADSGLSSPPSAPRQRGERAGDHAAPRAHGGLRRHPRRRPAAPARLGTFPRYLAVYVRELGLLVCGERLRRFTSLPAQRLRPRRPRPAAPRHGRRRRLPRPGRRARHRDLRRAAAASPRASRTWWSTASS